ncbi:hypothetical protein Poli38472_009890 [Pythium oligandrum]|uniref:Phospholipid/glycerol acyltransferase domain-containing protein n=1 Tax=Pythium oligandrum TaxID=41045 RepID=A0A8K1CHV7_PYTOL|nr:hypothetical protein Poli38472_009890 [Pythium oligandrum]|eukprot:TMW62397.1 hypothetical protein Poli38472_009890 [Pythium oligandrum]
MAKVTPLGAGFLATLVVTGWLGVSLVLTPFFLVAVIPLPPVARVVQPIYRRVTHVVQYLWMTNVALMLENVYGIRIEILGDVATQAAATAGTMNGERALWISNHRTRIDWMLAWSMAVRLQVLDRLKIILKAPLRKIPIFGWAMQHFLFIFLNRRWADDQVMLKEYLPFLCEKEKGASFLIFPEGTDLSDQNLVKSEAFAEKNGLEKRQYSLYPRTTGWTFIFPQLRANLDAVYDITMFYVDYTPNERPSELSLLSGRMPRTLYFYLERIKVSELPSEEKELSTWVETRFTQKEAHLKAFYEENGKLPDGAAPLSTPDMTRPFALVVAFWGIFFLLGCQWAWSWGIISSLIFGVLIIFGYGVATIFFGGIDGILRKTL